MQLATYMLFLQVRQTLHLPLLSNLVISGGAPGGGTPPGGGGGGGAPGGGGGLASRRTPLTVLRNLT